MYPKLIYEKKMLKKIHAFWWLKYDYYFFLFSRHIFLISPVSKQKNIKKYSLRYNCKYRKFWNGLDYKRLGWGPEQKTEPGMANIDLIDLRFFRKPRNPFILPFGALFSHGHFLRCFQIGGLPEIGKLPSNEGKMKFCAISRMFQKLSLEVDFIYKERFGIRVGGII